MPAVLAAGFCMHHMTDPLIIAFTGRAGAGKDTAAEHLRTRYGFVCVSYALALKEMLEAMLTARVIDYAYLYEPQLKNRPIPGIGKSARELMQTLGDWGRGLDPQFWVHALADSIGMSRADPADWAPMHDRIAVTDVRYVNEAAWVQQHGGQLVRLVRRGLTPVRAHSSEEHADTLPAQHVITNDSSVTELHRMLDITMAAIGVAPRPPVTHGHLHLP